MDVLADTTSPVHLILPPLTLAVYFQDKFWPSCEMPAPRDKAGGCGQLLKYTSLHMLASWTPQSDTYSLTSLHS